MIGAGTGVRDVINRMVDGQRIGLPGPGRTRVLTSRGELGRPGRVLVRVVVLPRGRCGDQHGDNPAGQSRSGPVQRVPLRRADRAHLSAVALVNWVAAADAACASRLCVLAWLSGHLVLPFIDPVWERCCSWSMLRTQPRRAAGIVVHAARWSVDDCCTPRPGRRCKGAGCMQARPAGRNSVLQNAQQF